MQARRLYRAVTVGLVLTAATNLNAQAAGSSGARIMIGPFVGVNYTTVSGDEVEDASYRAGLAAGGQLQADFAGGWFFRTAVLYSQRGADATINAINVTFKENYVEAPLLLGYQFASAGSSIRPFVMAGGQVGFKVSCNLSGRSQGASISIKCDDDPGTEYKSTDFGAVGGAGIMFPAAGGTMSLDVRYAQGLGDITSDSNARHRGFTAGIAYMIPLGR